MKTSGSVTMAASVIFAALSLASCTGTSNGNDTTHRGIRSCHLGGSFGPRAVSSEASAIMMQEVHRISPEGDPITAIVFPDDRVGNFMIDTRDCERTKTELSAALRGRLEELTPDARAQLASALDSLREITPREARAGVF